MSYQVHNFQTGEIIEAFPVNEMDAQIQLNETNINQKLNHNQGASNVGKFMVVDTDGELVPGEVDLSMKADKPSNPTNGDLAALDANGNLVDSGKKTSDFLGTETIDDTAGVGDDDLVWSADKLASEFRDVNAQKANTDSVSVLKEINGGFIVTVDDGIPEKVKVIDIEIAPKQDLNGYDKPWIGGAGKNLFYLSSSYATQGTVTYSPNPATGELTLGGSAPSSQTNRNLREISVSVGEKYFISGTPANGSPTTSCVRYVFRDSPSGTAVGSVTDVDSNGVVVTVPEGATIISIYSHTTTGTDPNGIVLKPFVAKSEVALPFEPYANICPISGWTKCKVARTGKNMADPDSLLSERIINESGGLNNNSDHKALVGMIPVKPLTTYTLSGKDMHVRASGSSSTSNAFVMVAEYAEGNWQSCISRTINSQSSDDSYTFTTSAKTHFVRFSTGIGATDVQFELGSFATTYTEYTGNFIYSIVLPDEAGTVYGGELSIFRGGAGMLEVDRKVLNITGENVTSTLNGGAGFYRAVLTIPDDSIVSNDGNVLTGKLLSDQYVEITNTAGNQGGTGLTYRGNGSHSIILSNPQVNSSAIADWKNWIDSHPFTIVYGLEITSFYSQFPTPAVEMVFGTNNIFADTGEIKQMTYPAERYLPAEQAEKERIHITVDEPSDVIGINDGADNVPMALKVAVEPVQDFHGYEYPWAGGAGKNLFKTTATSSIVQDVTITVNSDGTVTINGTNTGTSNIVFMLGYFEFDSAKSYKITGCTGGASNKYYINVPSVGNQYTDPITADGVGGTISIRLAIVAGVTVSNVTIKPMITLASETDQTFAPYENICPISGWTGANVTRTGKNLFDKFTITAMSILNQADGQPAYNANHNISDFIPASAGKTYVISGTGLHLRADGVTNTAGVRFVSYNSKKEKNGTVVDTTSSYVSYTTPDETAYIRVQYGAGASDVQVEEGSVPTTYEPFDSIYSVRFPSEAGTVYGGELTVNKDGTGELVINKKCIAGNEVTWVKHGTYNCFSSNSNSFTDKKPGTGYISGTGELDGSLASDSYAVRYETLAELSNGTIRGHSSQTTVYIRDDRFLNATSFNEYASNFHVCYELAEPITYSFTALQVRSLLGINNIWADTGEINEVQYSADTKMYVEEAKDEASAVAMSLIANIEPDVSTKRYYKGTMLIHDGELYEAMDTIAIGDALIENQNIKKSSLNYQFGYTYYYSIFNMDFNYNYVEARCHKVGPMRMVNAMLTKGWFNGSIFMGDEPPYESELYFPSHIMHTANNQTTIESCMLKYTKAELKWSLIKSDGTIINNIATSSAISSTDKIHLFAIWFV